MNCKHLNGRRVFMLGRQSNGNQILWCPECGSAKFAKNVIGSLGGEAKWYRARQLEALLALIDAPQTDDFFSAVRHEAAHQVERFGSVDDAGKKPQDWFWLLGYLSGKALASVLRGDKEKALHHTISSAAVLLNWHRSLSGNPTAMRPGIETPL